MYPWVTHMHSHLEGECSHRCDYCYVQHYQRKFKLKKFTGPIRLNADELEVKYRKNRIIFLEHMNDICASTVGSDWIRAIIYHCKEYPDNQYVFQTKNPTRYPYFDWPKGSLFGCTIETNRHTEKFSKAPDPFQRYLDMTYWARFHRTFITIEPVLKFDPNVLFFWIKDIHPNFVNIGADSKGIVKPEDEPNANDLQELIRLLTREGIEIRQKWNLKRILDK